MKINSYNEWDSLKEVIVGKAEGQACLVFKDIKTISEDKILRALELARKAFPQWLIDEANEDLNGLCEVLIKHNVVVKRPEIENIGNIYNTPYISAAGDTCYNMRDLHLIVGNNVIESPSQEKHRYFESMCLYDIWYDYFADGFNWIVGPKPRLRGDYLLNYEEDGQKYQKLTEDEILFEAANVVRMGKDLLYLISRSGNYLGAKWLQRVLGEDFRVHTTEEIYRSSHIDSSVVCLRPGLVLLNGARIDTQNCPKIFDKWEKIYFHDINPTPTFTLEFHNNVRVKIQAELKELNIETDIKHIASDWIGMNFLSVNPDTVIIDKRQTNLMKELEKHRINPIPVSFRHSHALKGGIHCCTLDTVREGQLEDYFN